LLISAFVLALARVNSNVGLLLIVMREENDWRLQGQEKYLKGAALSWKQYTRFSDTWEHDHCEFCWAKFMDAGVADTLHEGYATPDNYRWICAKCFADFADLFDWTVANQPPVP
jgi:hypothetical protein